MRPLGVLWHVAQRREDAPSDEDNKRPGTNPHTKLDGLSTGNPEVISSSVGLVPTNAPAVTNQSLEGSRLPVTIRGNLVSLTSVLPVLPTNRETPT
jgi:hypothetical protein